MASAQSTKVALGLQKYLKPIPRPYNRKISEQMSEYYGLGSFHCSEHETLALNLKKINEQYKQSSLEEKQKLASDELSE